MTNRHSSGSQKPAKPRRDFPLYAHATGRWAKRIRGKIHYFGPWADPQAALQKYLDQKDDLFAGRTPRASGEGVTVRDVVNRFLTVKKSKLESGELSPRTFDDYYRTCERVIHAFGKERLVIDLESEDFERLRQELSLVRGPVPLGNEIQRIRTVFKYAFEAGLIERPVRFGPDFAKPNRRIVRKARQARGTQMFEANEIRAMLDAVTQPMKAMILLGVNCGFGNSDVATLPLSALDMEGGWHNYARPKTGIERRAPLWPETVKALREAIAVRPTPKDSALEPLVFITKYGKSWAKHTSDNPISKEFGKLLIEGGMRHKPPKAERTKKGTKPRGRQPRPRGKPNGRSFYALRHTFETIAGESRDQVAVDYIMGHARDDMASVYRERISDERLRAVTDVVRAWLFPKTDDAER